MRQPGIEPGSTAWKAAMLTTIPLTLRMLGFMRPFHFYLCARWVFILLVF